jgi:DNA-binding MarR family transcriptional regulator
MTPAMAPPPPDPRAAAPLEPSPFFKLLLLVNLTAKPFGRLYERRFQLSLSEWRVMLTLASRPDLSATEIADALGLDKMAVSRALRGLEKRGRVERGRHPADGRRDSLALTEAGWELYRAIAPAARERENGLLSELDGPDRARLDAMLNKLLAGARKLPDG